MFFFELIFSIISVLPSSITFDILWDSFFTNFFVENVYESPTSADNEPELSFHVPIKPEVGLHTKSKPTPSQQLMEKCHDDLETENRRLLKELETLRQKSEQTDRSILHLEQSNKELTDLILESYKKESKFQNENESLKSCIHSLEKENELMLLINKIQTFQTKITVLYNLNIYAVGRPTFRTNMLFNCASFVDFRIRLHIFIKIIYR